MRRLYSKDTYELVNGYMPLPENGDKFSVFIETVDNFYTFIGIVVAQYYIQGPGYDYSNDEIVPVYISLVEDPSGNAILEEVFIPDTSDVVSVQLTTF